MEGHAVVDTGLRRSNLVSEEIDRAKQGHTLGATTMALLYAADFGDQLENKIVPALSAGSTVLADRYIYTLMARAIVRGASRDYARQLYGFAFRPDLVIFLDARSGDPAPPLDREVRKPRLLGVGDGPLPLARPLRELLPLPGPAAREFEWMSREYDFHTVDANRRPEEVHEVVRELVATLYGGKPPSRARRRLTPRAPSASA